MVDGRRQLRLAQEPLPERLAGGRRVQQQLEGNLPVGAILLGQVDHAHAPPAQ
jgi:hypothetical protein